MPIVQPQSKVILLHSTRLNDYKNQLDFADATAQYNWMINHRYQDYANFQYVRRDNAIIIPENYDRLYNCDYVMFQNSNFGSKWFYCFLRQKEYVNDSTTRLIIELDVFQTWQFNINYYKSFISKCHQQQRDSSNVPILNNLYPENVEYGRDYVVKHTEVLTWDTYYVLICSSADLTADFGDESNPKLVASQGGTFDRLPSVLDYYVVDNLNLNSNPRTATLEAILSALKTAPWVSQCIQSLTVVPREVIGDNWSTVNMANGLKIGKLGDGYVSSNFAVQSIPNWWSKFGNYTNSKLYTYPYSFIEMTAYNGTQFIIKPEALSEMDTLEIGLVNYVGASPRLAYYVKYYNDRGDNGYNSDRYGEYLDASIAIANFPQMPVAIDNYLLYQANNANSFSLANSINSYNKKEAVAFGAIEGGGGAVESLLGGNIIGAVNSLYGGAKSAYTGIKNSEISIRQQLAKIQDAEIAPPSLAGQTGGDAFNIANKINGVTLKWKTVRPEYASRLDEYFTRYGYTQNQIDYPSLKGNLNFNYIQTTGIILGGQIPKEDLDILKQMFDNGTTIWHNGTIGQYTTNPWIGRG